jgi:hypothetical protein
MVSKVLVILALVLFLGLVKANFDKFGLYKEGNIFLLKNEHEREILSQLLACNVAAFFGVAVYLVVKLVLW